MAANVQASEKLFNIMRISEKISHVHGSAMNLVNDIKITNRSYAIEWMKKVCCFF